VSRAGLADIWLLPSKNWSRWAWRSGLLRRGLPSLLWA